MLGLRLVFVVLLYGAVAAMLLALRRDLRHTASYPAGGAARGLAGGEGAVPEGSLILLEAAPADGSAGRTVPLRDGLTIGRLAPADVLLRDDAVSGRHARFALGAGGWVVEDLGSTNGTHVNGQRADGPTVLLPGDVVVTGSATWRFDAPPSPADGQRPGGRRR